VPQEPDSSGVDGFNLVGGNIVFSSAPAAGLKFWGVILAGADYVTAGTTYPDGSVNNPSITFSSQTTVGLYRSGTSQLAIALNNVNPITFTQSGLQFNGSTSGTVTVVAPAVASNNTLILPTTGTALSTIIPGEVKWFAMSTAPTGFLKANGAAVSRSTYSALFTAIGTTFGVGDGSTTFNLPDLRGEFVRGWDDGRGVDAGRVFGTAQSHAVQQHTHSYNTPLNSPSGSPWGGGAFVTTSATTGGMNSGNSAAETRPRNIALLACIAF
jgi:microcystin-dependent protein